MQEWYLLALLAPLLWAVSNVADRSVVGHLRVHPFVATGFSGLSGLLVLLAVPLCCRLELRLDGLTLLALLSGGAYGAATLLYFLAMQRGSAVLSATSLQLTPGVTLLLGHLALGERLLPRQYGGFAFFLVAALVMSPLSARGARRALELPAFACMFLACSFFGAASTLSKHVLARLPYEEFIFLTEAGALATACLLVTLHLLRRRRRRELRQAMRASSKPILLLVAVSETTNLAGLLSERAALLTGPVSLVSSIACAQPLAVAGLTAILRRLGRAGLDSPWEESRGRILFAVLLVSIGSAMVQT